MHNIQQRKDSFVLGSQSWLHTVWKGVSQASRFRCEEHGSDSKLRKSDGCNGLRDKKHALPKLAEGKSHPKVIEQNLDVALHFRLAPSKQNLQLSRQT